VTVMPAGQVMVLPTSFDVEVVEVVAIFDGRAEGRWLDDSCHVVVAQVLRKPPEP